MVPTRTHENHGSAGADTPTLRRSRARLAERTSSMAKVTQGRERRHPAARRSRDVVSPRLMEDAVRVFRALGITSADLRLRAQPGSVLVELADAMEMPAGAR
jgi:hypothetical protein